VCAAACQLSALGFEWGEAVQREFEAVHPFEQPSEMRRVADRPDDFRPTDARSERHPLERGGVAWPASASMTRWKRSGDIESQHA